MKILTQDRNPLERASTVASLLCVCLALIFMKFPNAVNADDSDTMAPVTLEADFVEIDDKNQEAVFKGNVTLRQGTLEINANEIIVKRDEKGFQYGKARGNPAHFRQKREGLDEHIDGYAKRIEYNGENGQLEMFEDAKITRGPDEVEGDYISYNMTNEFFQIKGGGKSAASINNPNGRVKAVIKPKNGN